MNPSCPKPETLYISKVLYLVLVLKFRFSIRGVDPARARAERDDHPIYKKA